MGIANVSTGQESMPVAGVRVPPIWLLGAMSGAGLFASMVSLPAIPDMARSLQAPVALAQGTLTVSLAGMAAAMLAVGPLSDRHGRLPLTRACGWLLLLGSFVAWLAPAMAVLLAGRLLQGLAAGGLVVLARSMLRDAYADRDAVRASAFVSMVVAIAPIVAPPLGGVLQMLFGWRAGFACVAVASAAMLVLMLRRLDETHPAGRRDPLAAKALRSYATLLAHRRFMALSVPVAMFTGAVFAYQAMAPVVMIIGMQVSPAEYGLYVTLPAASFILGNAAMLRLAHRFRPDTFIRAGYFGALLSGVAMLAAAYLLPPRPWWLVLPALLFTFSNGLMQSQAILAGTSLVPGLVGASAALSNFLRMAGSALGTVLVAVTTLGTPAGVGLVYFGAGAIALALWQVLRGGR